MMHPLACVKAAQRRGETTMKRCILAVAAILTACAFSIPALAQPPLARGATGSPDQKGTDKAPFGCDARTRDVCHFQIFYPRGGRGVVLPAGLKVTIPDIKIGRDSYCVGINRAPEHKCTRKIINATYNN